MVRLAVMPYVGNIGRTLSANAFGISALLGCFWLPAIVVEISSEHSSYRHAAILMGLTARAVGLFIVCAWAFVIVDPKFERKVLFSKLALAFGPLLFCQYSLAGIAGGTLTMLLLKTGHGIFGASRTLKNEVAHDTDVFWCAGAAVVGFLLSIRFSKSDHDVTLLAKAGLDILFMICVIATCMKSNAIRYYLSSKKHQRALRLRHIEKALKLQRIWIAQDLHDGVGAYLLEVIATSSRNNAGDHEMRAALEMCLTELRIAVDQLNDEEQSIELAIAMVRYRFQHAFDRARIVIRWHVDQDNFKGDASSAVVRDVRYILQHALSNILQHSRATEAKVSLRHDAEGNSLDFCISDNGQGFDQLNATQRGSRVGRGIKGFELRARRMNATFEIISSPLNGTSISMKIPMDQNRNHLG